MKVAATLLELKPVVFDGGLAVLQTHKSEQLEELALHVLVVQVLQVDLRALVQRLKHLDQVLAARVLLHAHAVFLAVLEELLEGRRDVEHLVAGDFVREGFVDVAELAQLVFVALDLAQDAPVCLKLLLVALEGALLQQLGVLLPVLLLFRLFF